MLSSRQLWIILMLSKFLSQYPISKFNLDNFLIFSRPSPQLILIAGAIGGIVSKTVVYPLDLCKKRLQIQKFGNSRTTFGEHFVCNGMFDCFMKTIAREGYAGGGII